MKCEGLSDGDLRRRSMPPSTLSLLGLVRHMAEVERIWFRVIVNGEDLPLVWSPRGDIQAAYRAGRSTREEAFAAWQAEVEHSRRIEAAAPSLDLVVHNPRHDEDVSLRLIMNHSRRERPGPPGAAPPERTGGATYSLSGTVSRPAPGHSRWAGR